MERNLGVGINRTELPGKGTTAGNQIDRTSDLLSLHSLSLSLSLPAGTHVRPNCPANLERVTAYHYTILVDSTQYLGACFIFSNAMIGTE